VDFNNLQAGIEHLFPCKAPSDRARLKPVAAWSVSRPWRAQKHGPSVRPGWPGISPGGGFQAFFYGSAVESPCLRNGLFSDTLRSWATDYARTVRVHERFS
jgi:hypothetical protein